MTLVYQYEVKLLELPMTGFRSLLTASLVPGADVNALLTGKLGAQRVIFPSEAIC